MITLRTALALGLLAGTAVAQDPTPADPIPALPPAELTEEELLVARRGTVTTGGRREQPASRSSAATTVITSQEIRESGAQRLTEVLRSVAGVNVTRTSVDDAMVNIRGLNTPGNPALMLLIDGRPAQVEFFGVTLWDHLPVLLESIERIEVVRGPASPLYGANAFSGVVNVITADPRDAEGAEAILGAGNHGWTHARGVAGTHTKRGGMWLSAGFDQSEGWSNRVDPTFVAAQDPIVAQRNRTDTQLQDFRTMWRGRYAITDQFRITGDAGYLRSTQLDFLTADTTWIIDDYDHAFVRAGAEYSSDATGDVAIRLWARHDSLPAHTLYATPGGPDFELDDTIGNQVLDFEATRTVRPFEGNVLTYGGGFRYAWVTADEIFGEDERTSVGSLWIQDEYRLHPTLDVSLSLRWDDHSTSGSHLSPRGAIVWAPADSQTFRLSAGRAFRNPTNVQNFASVNIPTNLPAPFPGSVALTGDSSLNAEQQTTVQLDWSTNALEGALLETSVFYGLLENLIVYRPPPAGPLNYANVGDTEIAGGEISLQGKLLPWLRGFANYGLIWANGEFEGHSPKHQGSLGLRATVMDGLSAAVTLNAVSGADYRGSAALPERHVDPYAVLSGRIAYRYERAEIACSASGVIGEQQAWPRGDDTPWQIILSLRYRF